MSETEDYEIILPQYVSARYVTVVLIDSFSSSSLPVEMKSVSFRGTRVQLGELSDIISKLN